MVATSVYERLVQHLFPDSRLLSARSLSGGISAEMTVLEIAGPDGHSRKVVLRRPGSRHHSLSAEDEFRLLQIMHALGLATPQPCALDSSGQILSGPYLVMDYIQGQPDFSPARPDDFARQMAVELSKIHSVYGYRNDLAFLPGPVWRAELDHRPVQMNSSLDEERIRSTLGSVWPVPRTNELSLLHGDYWPGNILWHEGRLAAVIDWEDARVGDPLADLAISRLDLLWICGREAMEAFTHHYLALTRIDTNNLPYWDLYAALRLVRLAGADLKGWAEFFVPYGRSDITERSIREYYRFFVDQAFDRLNNPK